MIKKVKIGVLSTANISKRSLIPAIKSLPELYELRGIASRDLSKAEELAREFDAEAYGSYEALLDKEIIDAVYIPLPNALHYRYAKLALASGIHVLVEKSLACSLSEVEELVELAKKNKLVMLENFQFRFHSQLKFLKEQIKNGKLGELRMLKAFFGFPPFADADNIRYQKHLGGGALLDAGAYTTKISQILLGLGLQVKAASLNSAPAREVDIWGGAYLEHPDNGVFATLAFGFDLYYQCGVELWFSKGKISTNRLFTAPAPYEPKFEIENAEGKSVLTLDPDDHFSNMLSYFFDCIFDSGKMEKENEQNLDQARLLESIKIIANGK
jgi:dTDP-3,4-didehydro-2,6-dideoxy-alpha-D-glucose 3-reductase